MADNSMTVETEQDFRDMMAFFYPRVTVTNEMVDKYMSDLKERCGRPCKLYDIRHDHIHPHEFEFTRDKLS